MLTMWNNKLRIGAITLVAVAAFAMAPSAFAGNTHVSVGFYGTGYGVSYSSCHHCGRGGYGGRYYAPAYYSSYYSPVYYPSYGAVYYEAPIPVRHVYRKKVRYYDNDDHYRHGHAYYERDRSYSRAGYYDRGH